MQHLPAELLSNRESLTRAYHRLTAITTNNAGQLASDAFNKLGSWRTEDIQRYIDSVLPGMDNAKRTMSNYTAGYYGRIAADERQIFKSVSVPPTALTTQALRNGTTAQMIWERPFKEMWGELGKGKDFSTALQAGARRADWTARTEIELAKRQAGLTVRDGNTNIVGYLRTLSGAENCGLCYLASTQRYRRGDLLPIHPGCDCGETPIYGNTDVGQIVDQQTLDATHEAVEQRFGQSDASGRQIDYRKIKIVNHTELGPYLTVEGHEFTKVKPQDLKTPIKIGKKVDSAIKLTFLQNIKPRLDKISPAKIADDIKLEHGSVNVAALKGKAKVQALGERTSGHLDSITTLGAEIDGEITKRVVSEVNSISTATAVKAATKKLESSENLLAQTKLKYEASYQKGIADELAKLDAEIQFKYKGLVARGSNKEFLDEWQGQWTQEKRLRIAEFNAKGLFDNSAAGQALKKEIGRLNVEVYTLKQTLPGNIIPGSERYNQIYSAKAREVLAEVRDLGQGGPKFAGSVKVNDILDEAKTFYPSDWLNAAEAKFGAIETKTVARGYFNNTSKTLAVSFDKAQGFTPGLATAVHEMGHMFEYSVTGIKELEFAFAHKRAALNPKRTNLGSRESGFEDAWRNLYSGKDYGYSVDSAYEVFTTGVESVFSGSNHFSPPTSTGSKYTNKSLPSNIPIDDEFRKFVLGVLFSL